MQQDRAPAVFVGVHHLSQRGSKQGGVWILLAHAADHFFEGIDLGVQFPAARLRALDAKGELEILLVADQYIRLRGDLRKHAAQLRLAPFPGGGALVHVKADPRSRGARNLGEL